MDRFAEAFRARKNALIPHGAGKKVAQFVGVHPNEITRWGELRDGRAQIPDIAEIQRTAEYFKASPAWLAFGQGPQDLASAQAGFTVGEQLEQHPGLRELIAYYTSLPPAERAAMLTVLRIPMVPAEVQGAQTSGTPSREMARKVAEAAGAVLSVSKADGVPVYGISPKEMPETKGGQTVASEAPAAYAGELNSSDDAAEWVRGLGKRMKRTSEVDLSKAAVPIRRGPLHEVEERAAADHLRTYVDGGTGPIVAETEPTEIKYPRATHFTLKVTGRSMWPTIFEGDKIIVERTGLYLAPLDDENPAPLEAWKKLDREIIVAIKNEDTEAYVKRVEISKHKRTGWRILLRSDNPAAKSIDIDKEDSLLVVGIVREIVRDPKNVG